MVFLITGLQARTVISRVGEYPLSQLAISVAVITAVVIVARFVLGLSCRLPTAMAVPRNQKEGPFASVAMAISAGIHRCTGHRFARGSARYSASNCYGTAISLW
jgi:hypothetical protein